MVNFPWMIRCDDPASKYTVNNIEMVKKEKDEKDDVETGIAEDPNGNTKETSLIISPKNVSPDGITAWKRQQMERVLIDAGLLEDYDRTGVGYSDKNQQSEDCYSIIIVITFVCVFFACAMYLLASKAFSEWEIEMSSTATPEGSGYGSLSNQ